MKNLLLNTRPLLSCFLLSGLLALAALQPAIGQQSFSQSLDLKQMEFIQAEIQINAGVLNLSTHNRSDAALDFFYSKNSWRPKVELERGGRDRLLIRQPEGKNFNMKDGDRNEWDIKLPRRMAGELTLRIGAGEANIDLQGAKLERLTMEAGAGDFNMNLANTDIDELVVNAGVGSLKLDLSGKRSANLRAQINGGIGDLKLQLPNDTGVRIKVSGLGSVNNFGLTKQDGYYVNEAYGKSKYSIEIIVNGGLGSVEMALENQTY